MTTTSPRAATLSASQRERRQRILDAAATLASQGGYEAVQMRTVAETADVALGTLYRYFASKVHLLVSTMHRQLEQLAERLEHNPPSGETAGERVLEVLGQATRAMQRDPQLADAMVRALMFADASAAEEVDSVSAVATDSIVRAIHGSNGAVTPDELARARVIEQVWFSSILAWLSGRSTPKQMTEDLEVATRLLLS